MEPDTQEPTAAAAPEIEMIRRVSIEKVEDGTSSSRGYIRCGVRWPIGDGNERSIGVLKIPMEFTLIVRGAHRDQVTVALTTQGGRVLKVEREPTPFSRVMDWLQEAGARCLNGKGTVTKYQLETGALILVEKLARGGVEVFVQATREDSLEAMFAELDRQAGREPMAAAAVLDDGAAFEIPERTQGAPPETGDPRP